MSCIRSKIQLLLVVHVCVLAFAVSDLVGAESREARWRPVALASVQDGQAVAVVSRDRGALTVFDTESGEQTAVLDCKGRLTDLAKLDESHLVAVDVEHDRLVLLTSREAAWQIESEISLPGSPNKVVASADGKSCFVSALWSQRISRVEKDEEGRLVSVASRELPFEPLHMCLTPGGHFLIVADAFEAQMVTLRTDDLHPVAKFRFDGHNVSGICIHDGRVWWSMQRLNPLAHSTRDDVHWGNMLSNLLCSVELKDLLRASDDELPAVRELMMGEPARGAGDPGKISVNGRGEFAVLLQGVGEVAIGDPERDEWKRVPVGEGPRDVLWLNDGQLLVTNTFADSVARVQTADNPVVENWIVDQGGTLTEVDRGEALFFDSTLALDGWMSCHSCHSYGHSSGQLNDNLSDGGFGAPKRIPSLHGVHGTEPFAWTGTTTTLTQQMENSVMLTMQGTKPSSNDVRSLVAFVSQLKHPQPGDQDTSVIAQGQDLFRRLECIQCHQRPNFTSPKTYNVGFEDEVGNREFNPPSLAGVGNRRAFFHDGRATEIREVFSRWQHQLDAPLSSEQTEELVRFLQSL